ncbi:hypothetical protein QDW22_gp39 [Microbacterium Phage DirtyBubble]|uniref:hypothetical protein n=1 Tax=Microbacterium Phage DirtyBubble TaxID=2590932 RepID=UPI001189AE72|nr:hypothetical protein QDW22_gp39 [Microbacterium Phage DirtyBubble]QDP45057.1 hypothetical protein DIRTYBUBBLE_39 [Microbacterium Phage DirtyBubble]
MSEPMHDAQLAGLMSLDPAQMEADAALQDAMFDGECPVEEAEPERYAGPSPVLVRQSSKQSWAQAKTLDVLKDMGPRRLADWVAGLNEVAGFAKYRVA